MCVFNKVSRSIANIRRVAKNIPISVLVSLYFILVHHYFEYCNVIWANSNISCLKKLFVCQQNAVCVVLKLEWNAPMHLIMKDMNILNTVNINIFQIDCYMYKAMINLLSTHLSNYFVINNVLHAHYTRQSDNLHVISHAHKLGLTAYVLEVLLFGTLLK